MTEDAPNADSVQSVDEANNGMTCPHRCRRQLSAAHSRRRRSPVSICTKAASLPAQTALGRCVCSAPSLP